MSRTIDADALIQTIKLFAKNSVYDEADVVDRLVASTTSTALEFVIKLIDQEPTVEADRPKGRWSSTLINGKLRWTCSKCGHYCKHIKTGLPNWCEWCGADMREGKP